MILVTSLSPTHRNFSLQQNAIDSWNNLGIQCVSLNGVREIDGLKKDYTGIEFIETHRTLEKVYGKPLVSINAMIDFAISRGHDLILINSDILLAGLPELRQDGITIMAREDYESKIEVSQKFIHGFDFFFIPKHFLKVLPPCMYGLGNCFFDFWIPVTFINAGIPIYTPREKYAFHKLHNNQYSFEEWLRTGEMFRWEFNRTRQLDIGRMTTNTMASIQSHLIHI